jgi:hypothetical protein
LRTDAALLAETLSDLYDPVVRLQYYSGGWVDVSASVMEAIRIDLPYSCQCTVKLDNSDGALDSLEPSDHIWRLAFGSGANLSDLPWLWGEGGGDSLSMDDQAKSLMLEGAWERLARWICKENHTTFGGDGTTTDAIYGLTIKGMINWVCQQAHLGYWELGSPGGLATSISEDSYIDVWTPYFIMYAGQTGFQIVKALLEMTSCVLVPYTDTFKLKKIDPAEASVYTYSDTGYHYFDEVQHEKHLWKPMKVTVLGPITYVHKVNDTVNGVTADAATSKASFVTLERDIKTRHNDHIQNSGGAYHSGEFPAPGSMVLDSPHKVVDTNVSDATGGSDWYAAARLACMHRVRHNAHIASTTYHLAADSGEHEINMRLRHEKRTSPEAATYPFTDPDNLATAAWAEDETTAIALMVDLAAEYAEHRLSLYHKENDTTNVLGSPINSLATAIARANEFKAALNAHGASTVFHYNADTDNIITSDDATILTDLCTLLNEERMDYNLHLGMPQAELLTLLNECKDEHNAHIASLSYHYAADTWSGITADDAVDQSSAAGLGAILQTDHNLHIGYPPDADLIAIANEHNLMAYTHFDEAGTHQIDDIAGRNALMAVAGAATLGAAYDLVTTTKTWYNLHLTRQAEYSQTYTHADWVEGMGEYVLRDIYGLATSDANCLALATAMVLRSELESDKGWIVTQGINALQELFDVVEVAGDVNGVKCTERIGGIRWYWRPLDGEIYQTIILGGVEYALQSNDNWMADDLKLLQDQSTQQAVASVPVAPTSAEVIKQSLANGQTVTVDYKLIAGYLYTAHVKFENTQDDEEGFTISAIPHDSTDAVVGGTAAAKLAGGRDERSFTFYSGNTAGAVIPYIQFSVTNNVGSARTFTVTLTLMKLM